MSESKYNFVNCGLNILTNKEVIIKMFRKYKARYYNLELFMTELDIRMNTRHPNVVDYLKALKIKIIYIIMEKLDSSLPKYLTENVSTKQEIYSIIYIGCRIQYLHKLGIAHLDIKLDNICIGNTIKIFDFGVSAYISKNQKLKLKCGTKSYISPEICLDQECDHKTDIGDSDL
jgi:serine/threonine protein kinase